MTPALKLLLPLLIAAHALGLICLAATPSVIPDPRAAVLLGLALAQLILVLGWAVFGNGNLALRCAAALLMTTIVAVILSERCELPFHRAWHNAFHFALAGGAGLLLWRAMRSAMAFVSQNRPRNDQRPFQFSIGNLFSLTTAVAMVLGAGDSVGWSAWRGPVPSATTVIAGVALAGYFLFSKGSSPGGFFAACLGGIPLYGRLVRVAAPSEWEAWVCVATYFATGFSAWVLQMAQTKGIVIDADFSGIDSLLDRTDGAPGERGSCRASQKGEQILNFGDRELV